MKTDTKKASKKSQAFTDEEIQELNDLRDVYKNDSRLAIDLRISREVLLRVVLAKSGSPKTVRTIRTALKKIGTKEKRDNKEMAI